MRRQTPSVSARSVTLLSIIAATCSVGVAAHAQAPQITSFNPLWGPPGTVVQLQGSKFTGVSALGMQDQSQAFQFVSDTSIRMTVVAGAVSGKIKVVTPGGSGFTSLCFTVSSTKPGAPVIQSLSPTAGSAGARVMVMGTGLGTASKVTVGGVATGVTIYNDRYASFLVPQGARSGPVVLTTVFGTGTGPAFTVNSGSSGSGGGSGGGGGLVGGVIPPPPHVNPPAGALTSHPRLWIRGVDLPRLRSWAVSTNPIWKDLQSVANVMKTHMIQGIVPQQDSGDGEGNAYQYPTEEYAEMFALMSLVDPSAANRADWAKRAHDLMMYMMGHAVQGPAAGQPFRSPHFATYNRSRWYGEAFPLVVDWCYQTFTPAEKALIRKVFVRWIHENLDFNVAGTGYTPQPAGTVNSPTLVASPGQVRWSANNYWCNHARNVGMMSLALDAADDVPAATGDWPANYLRDYIGNAIGCWLYIRNHAENHDLAGGLSPEGPGYGESSLSALSMLMLALRSAGYDSPATYGPGAQLAQNSFWTNDVTDAYIHSLSPQTHTFYNWMPLMYLPAGYGDVLRFETNDMIREFGPLAMMDIIDGNNPVRLNKIRWMQTWLSPGGPANQSRRLTSSINNYGTMLPILYFLVFDPTAPAATDPRPAMSTQWLASGLNRVLARTDWTPNATFFTFISTWNVIDHQWGDANSFSLYRHGEWLTKEWAGYGKNIGASDYQNTLSLENPPSGPNVQSYTAEEAKHGGQYSYVSNGDPVALTALQPGYVYVQGDATKRYNASGVNATGIQHASRSILWLKPDILVIYDRATSAALNRYKRFYLNFATAPVIAGNKATVTTPKGQKLFITNLLPAGATLTGDQPPTKFQYEENAQDEPMHFRLRVEDPSNPQNVRFLNILQGADANVAALPASLLQSTAGSSYQGVVVNKTAVLFAVNLGQAFSGVTYTAPSSVTTHYVSGLTPNGKYTVTKQTVGSNVVVTVAATGATTADSAGVIRF